MKFLERYIQFLNEMESIEQNHEGVTDTDVRERLREIINYYFVWQNPIETDIPRYFYMPTPEGDKNVFVATYTFLIDSLVCAQSEGLDSAQARHQALENPAAISDEGHVYEEFLCTQDTPLPPKKPSMGDDYGYFDYK